MRIRIAVLLCLTGCGYGLVEPVTSSVVLRGVAASPAFTGSIELNLAVSDAQFQRNDFETDAPADGKLVLVGSAPILFTGTYNTKTRTVRAAGGGYTFAIDVPGTSFIGFFASASDSGQLIGLNTSIINSNNGFVRYPIGVQTLCGTYARGSDEGRVNLTASETTGAVLGVVLDGAGRAMRLDGTMDPLGQVMGTFVAPDGLSNIRARLTAGDIGGFMSGPAGAGEMTATTC